ncbi:MAG: IMPACT family protein [Bacteroidia bacterium]
MLFDDTYKTIEAPAEGIFKDRGSKFLGFAYPVSSEQEVKNLVEQLRKTHTSAAHHCYAFRIGPDKTMFRANDDGEPSGTGGRPILGQIQSHDLTNILIVVVRYFGGTLLGVSGLINAYKSGASEALAQAKMIEKQVQEIYRIEFPYDAMNKVMKILKDEHLQQWAQDFQLTCSLEFSVRKNEADRIIGLMRDVSGLKLKWLKTE